MARLDGTRAWRQYFTADGAPLCLSCAVPYDERSRERFGHPFCAEACARRFRVLSAPGAAREALRRLERGVCRLCGLDCEGCSADSSPSRASPNGWRVSRRSGSSARTRAGRGGAAQGGGPLAGGSRVPVAEGGAMTWITIGRCANGVTGGDGGAEGARAREEGEKDARGTADIRGFFAAGGGALPTDGDE